MEPPGWPPDTTGIRRIIEGKDPLIQARKESLDDDRSAKLGGSRGRIGLNHDDVQHAARSRPFSTVGIEPLRMASRAEVGIPYVRGFNTGGVDLVKNRLLKVEIQVSRTTAPIDRGARGKLSLKRCGTSVVDLITTAADPRPDNGPHGLGRHVELLTQTRDGGGDDPRRSPLASRVHNAHGRQSRSGEDNREAIRSDDRQREMCAIGDEAVSWCPPHQLRVIGLGQDNDPIAMNLPEAYEIAGIDPKRPPKLGPIRIDARAVIATPEP